MARPADPMKKEKIIQAAITTFAQNGYAGTRIAEVAESAGIGKGTIYEYFRSKEDLFFATFEYFTSETAKQIVGMTQIDSGPVSRQLSTLSEAVMKQWLAHLDLFGLVLEFWSATAVTTMQDRFKEAFNKEYARYRHVIGALIDKGIAEGEFRSDIPSRQIASALMGTWDALLFQAWFDPDFDPIEAASAHMEVMLAGLKSRPDEQGE